MERLILGDFELTAVSDGDYFLDGGAYFGVVPKVLWERKVKVDEKNRVLTGLNSVVVRNNDLTILIETGVGNKLPEKIRKIHGMPVKLLDNLKATGIAPEDIDIVINSHLHFDHCGWNTVIKDGKPVPTFPNATYYAQHGEWEHAHQNQRDGVSYFTENYDPLVESGQMKLLRGDAEISPYIGVLPFILAIVGVWRMSDKWVVRYLIILAIGSYLYSLGSFSFIHGLLYLLPALDKAREAAGMLAAAGETEHAAFWRYIQAHALFDRGRAEEVTPLVQRTKQRPDPTLMRHG